MPSKRRHAKSRLGCKNCKRRRIKCDETPPFCSNCAKKGLECDYRELNTTVCGSNALVSPTSKRKGHDIPSRHLNHHLGSHCFSLEDLGLMHHFTRWSYKTLGATDRGEHNSIWQNDVPRLAQSHAFLMHAMLGFTAAHQAASEPDLRLPRLQMARDHYSKALVFFRESVIEVDAERADAVLSFGIIICFLTLFLGSQAPLEEQDPVGYFIDLTRTLHGPVGMLKPVEHHLQASTIGGILRHVWDREPHPIDPDAHASLARLENLVSSLFGGPCMETDELNTIKDALAKLRRYFTLADPKPSEWANIMSLPIELCPRFLGLLNKRNAIALCIVAHWCVPAYNAPGKWFVGDWPKRLIQRISRQLNNEKWREYIAWPLRETIGEGM